MDGDGLVTGGAKLTVLLGIRYRRDAVEDEAEKGQGTNTVYSLIAKVRSLHFILRAHNRAPCGDLSRSTQQGKWERNLEETVIYCARVENSNGAPTRAWDTIWNIKTKLGSCLQGRTRMCLCAYICMLGAGHHTTGECS